MGNLLQLISRSESDCRRTAFLVLPGCGLVAFLGFLLCMLGSSQSENFVCTPFV